MCKSFDCSGVYCWRKMDRKGRRENEKEKEVGRSDIKILFLMIFVLIVLE